MLRRKWPRTRKSRFELETVDLFPAKRGDVVLTGERALAAAVLKRALIDARGNVSTAVREGVPANILRSSALSWVTQKGHGFRFWCRVAGVNPDAACKRFVELKRDYP